MELLENKDTIRFKNQVFGDLFLTFLNKTTIQVRRGGVVDLTPAQIEYLDNNSSVFKLGKLVEIPKDPILLEKNENMLTDEEIKEILALHWKKALSEINKITSYTTLSRLLYLAEQENVSFSVITALRERVEKMRNPAERQG